MADTTRVSTNTVEGTDLARTLRTPEFFALAFGTMVGVGWLVVIDDWLTRGGPGGGILGFLLGGIALIPVAYVYAKFVRLIPDAASELAYATSAFPPLIGYFSAWLMTLAYLIVCPWEAVAVGRIVGYLLPGFQTGGLYSVGGSPVSLPSLLLGIGLTGFIVFLNYRGIRISSRFQNITTFGLLALFASFSILGFTHLQSQNFHPFFAQKAVSFLPGSIVSIILVLQIVPYFLTGFESVPKCCEEAQKGFRPEGFVKAIFLGLGVGVAFYVIIITVVSGLAPWQSLIREKFATAVAFQRTFHSDFIVRLILFAALLALLKVFNANFIAASRLIFGLGRRRMIPAGLGKVHASFQTPHLAVLFCGVLTLCGPFLGSSILVPITEVGSMCSALGWTVTCLAFAKYKGKRRNESGAQKEITIAIIGAIVAIIFLLLKLLWFVPGSFRQWEYVALAGWIALGLIFRRRTDEQS
jgi:basic amino acid/polyamine antiporter, APA family